MRLGIIPARAGFTASVSVSGLRPRDHPRSRGVYRSALWVRTPPLGSSPLARGLQIGGPLIIHGRGIIPARAGFTRRVGVILDTEEDHPRSRGVY